MATLFRATFPKAVEIYFGPFTETSAQTTVGIIHLDGQTGEPTMAFYGRHSPGAGSAGAAMDVYRTLSWVRVAESAVPTDVQAELTEVLSVAYIRHTRLAADQALWWRVKAEDDIDDAAHTEMTLTGRTLRQRERQRLNALNWLLLPLLLAALVGWYFFGK
jgi:hypothetical protein